MMIVMAFLFEFFILAQHPDTVLRYLRDLSCVTDIQKPKDQTVLCGKTA